MAHAEARGGPGAERPRGGRRPLGPLVATLGLLAVTGVPTPAAARTLTAPQARLGAGSGAPTWQRQAVASSPGSFLTGVSCATPTNCVAVGTQSFPTHQGALAYSFTGGTWHQDVAAQPPGSTNAGLQSVSCTTAAPGRGASPPTCVAVGYTGIGSETARPFSEVLRGSTWRAVAVPRRPRQVAELLSVSCWSPDGCFAVGVLEKVNGGDSGAVSAVFNGASWAIVNTAAAVPTNSALDGVSCLTATVPPLCTAVGSKTVGHTTSPLLELANSTHGWTEVPVPAMAGSSTTALTSVACPAPDSCIAVGSTSTSSGSRPFSVVDSSGRWTVATPPRPSTPGRAGLDSVVCTLFLDGCQAVGLVASAASVPLIEQFNGTSWSPEPVPPPSSLSTLVGVACAFPASAHADQMPCTAVGSYSSSPQSGEHVLVLHR